MTSAIGDTIFREVIAKLVQLDNLLREVIDSFGVAVAWAASQLTELGPWLRTKWEEFRTKALEALSWIRRFSENPFGDAAAIRQLGEDWVNQIGAVASAQAQALQRGQLPSNGKWDGSAATAYYTGVVPNQTGSLSALKDATDMVNEGVNEVANAVESFWANIGIAVAAFLTALAGALVAKATILGIPPGLLALILACAVFVAAVVASITSLGNSLDMVDRLFAAATNVQPVVAGWPQLQSVDTLSDGSVKDRDPSEWRPTA